MINVYFGNKSISIEADNIEVYDNKLVISRHGSVIGIFSMDQIIGYVRL